MRRSVILTMIVASLGSGVATSAPETELTLPEAIRQALAQNPKQVSQRLEVGKAGAAEKAARGARWPTLEFSAAATHYAYPTLVHGIRTPYVFPPLDDTLYDYGVALRLPLYAGGRLAQGVSLAELGRQVAHERERQSNQELTYNVSAVYLKVQHLTTLEETYDARIASLEAQEKRVRLLREVGKAAKLDQLKIAGLLTRARYDRVQLANRRAEASSLLYQLMGMERPARAVTLTRYRAAAAPSWSLESLRQEAEARRPELRISEQLTAAGKAREAIARGERLPNVAIVGAYRERAGADTDYYDDWNVGVQLSIPLFDGGVRRARVDEAALTRSQAEQAVVQTRLEVVKQVQDAWDAYGEAQARHAVTATSVAEAREALSIEQLKYEQGVGLITDLLSAESALLAAQADRLQAEFDVITTRFNLLRAGGTLDPERAAAQLAPDSGAAQEEGKP